MRVAPDTGVPVASSTFPDMEAVTSAQAGASVATSPNNSLNESGIYRASLLAVIANCACLTPLVAASKLAKR